MECTEMLISYLKGRRNIRKRLYKFMSTTYRAVGSGRMTWENAIKILER